MGICSDYLVKPQRVNFAVRIVDINGKVLEKGESIKIYLLQEREPINRLSLVIDSFNT